jgi:hypothetical protein
MKYQLTIQCPAFSVEDYDAMIAIEDVLMEKLTEANEVDGHDAGIDEFNIFVRTDNPESAFNEVRNILGSSAFWVDARVAYRELSGSEYCILWPKGLTKFQVK